MQTLPDCPQAVPATLSTGLEASLPALIVDPVAAAKAASLHYVSDARPGIRRKRFRSGFVYLAPDGTQVRDPETLARIKSLVIPPAWTEVWICRDAQGHLQATGRDARGRKQYRYHPGWREIRDQTKYGRMVLFGSALSRIRRRVQRDIKLPGVPRNKVLATIVRLLETTLIRVGNEEYARTNRSFGLTTLRNQHALVRGATIVFKFRGKSGVSHVVGVTDRRLAALVRQCQELPGHELFQYQDDDGCLHAIGSADVNDYLREISGQDFTAKDFRTWAGTVLSAILLSQQGPFESDAQAKRVVAAAIQSVAQRLGNTPAVCRKCYVHPAVIEGYVDGSVAAALTLQALRAPESYAGSTGLSAAEKAVLQFLSARLSTAASSASPAPSRRGERARESGSVRKKPVRQPA